MINPVISTFRNIRVVRNGSILKHIDIYNLLVHADPSAEKRVIVAGEFVRTGLFETKGEETLKDLIGFAGGISDNAFKNRVFVHRKTSTELEVQDIEKDRFDQYVLQPGDSVTSGALLERYANRIKIGGVVFRPGSYELTPGMGVLELIRKAEGIKEEAYLNRGQIFRLDKNNDTLALAFNVADVVNGIKKIDLQREDSVSIKMDRELHEEYYVEILGEVNDPGKKSYYNNMTVQDLVYLSGGFTENADVKVIEIARRLTHDEAAILTESIGHVFNVSVRRDLNPLPGDNNLPAPVFLPEFIGTGVRWGKVA